MPFGLKGAPAHFQRQMDLLLHGVRDCAVYIDDIVIYFMTWKDHLSTFGRVLERLQGVNLKVKPSKCHLAGSTVQFLGHQVGQGRIQPQTAKIKHIQDFPVPTNQKQLRSLLGLTENSSLGMPHLLTALTSKKLPKQLNWTSQLHQDFLDLKTALANTTFLVAPDHNKKYILSTEASDVGVGAVLEQEVEGRNFFSAKLKPREWNYPVMEKEGLALVSAIKHFSPYLLGAEFEVVTDHSALKSIQENTRGGPGIIRWSLFLQQFKFTVTHRPGRQHVNVDDLSRYSLWTPYPDTPSSRTRPHAYVFTE